MEGMTIDQLASDILSECTLMQRYCQTTGIALPSLLAGATPDFWSTDSPQELIAARTRTLGLLERITTLLRGPHDFIHEYVASNWDQGALYVFLRTRLLEHIAVLGGEANIGNLATASGVPEDKLIRILGLLCCKNIVRQSDNGIYALTAISEDMIQDPDFRAWVEFQLFETRIASVHLADALESKPNTYTDGKSAFKQGFGVEMYEWHTSHPEEGDRFRRAMKGVSNSLDPADSLIRTWIKNRPSSNLTKVVEIGGRYGFASTTLVREKEDLSFELRCDSEEFLRRGQALVDPRSMSRISFTHLTSNFEPPPPSDANTVCAYVIRNLFWNWTDDEAVRLLQQLAQILHGSPWTHIIVTDGVSPLPGEFPPHVEISYRRRDITTMTMHNVKQRSQEEWLKLFSRVDPALKITTHFESSSHVCKGLWELRLETGE
ncbi:O-methyltransferase, putative [Talaromyces stipitatus ATCC 10500]|uniref:O-methyltransferase, putative n=2 Tax=Talaromyces stipitatus TaxID=28564 RepID=B8LZ57_TALSN|nr:O-methyltransferase, putative [Talaromyces stipitatus ATCC 10500]EED21101.1 O-methyltransferase, putative [Talaromyces stipitatus ATCC 10500]